MTYYLLLITMGKIITNKTHNNIVDLHPVAHCYFTFTFTFPLRLLCGLSMF
jgi:hypothetical protein